MIQPIPSNVWGDIGNGYGMGLWMNITGVQPVNYYLCEIGWPLASTFKNLYVQTDNADITWTLRKNGLDTALTGITASGIVRDPTNTVAAAIGDLFFLRRSGVNDWHDNVNVPLSTVVEVDTGDDYLSVYGSSMQPGSGAAGLFGAYGRSGTGPSCNTVSVAPINGNVIRLMIFGKFGFQDAAKGVRGTLYINNIKQDGSGGTIDTQVDLMATEVSGTYVFAYADFECPFAIGNPCVMELTEIGADLGSYDIGHSCVVRSDLPHRFMICGSNQTGVGYGGPYATTSVFGSVPGRWGLSEAAAQGNHNRCGITPIKLTQLQWLVTGGGMYTGPDTTFNLYKNGGNPPNQPTLSVTSGDTYKQDSDATHIVDFVEADLFSLNALAASAPSAQQVHWSFAGYRDFGPTPADIVNKSGIYYIERNKRDDTYFTSYSPIRTIDVKIP